MFISIIFVSIAAFFIGLLIGVISKRHIKPFEIKWKNIYSVGNSKRIMIDPKEVASSEQMKDFRKRAKKIVDNVKD